MLLHGRLGFTMVAGTFSVFFIQLDPTSETNSSPRAVDDPANLTRLIKFENTCMFIGIPNSYINFDRVDLTLPRSGVCLTVCTLKSTQVWFATNTHFVISCQWSPFIIKFTFLISFAVLFNKKKPTKVSLLQYFQPFYWLCRPFVILS